MQPQWDFSVSSLCLQSDPHAQKKNDDVTQRRFVYSTNGRRHL